MARASTVSRGDRVTALILRRWVGPLPQLAQSTDAGEKEDQYSDVVPGNMAIPRVAKQSS
jgi:hypothetical protein